MTRRDFLRFAAAATACGMTAACGSRAPGAGGTRKVPRVGYLSLGPPPSPGTTEPFVDGMRDLGYVDGQNIVYDFRYASGAVDQMDELAGKLVATKPDVLVAETLPPTLAAQRATSTIPIVFTIVIDPVENGVVDSLARPGGNLTGLATITPQTSRKYLELLQQLIPGISDVGALFSSDYPGMVAQLKSIEAAGQALNIRVHPIEAKRREDFEAGFQAAASAKLPALIITSSPLTGPTGELTDLAIKYRLPTAGTVGNVAASKVVMYGPNVFEIRRAGAGYVDRILKGAKPADLPVQEPTKFELVINLKMAKAIGITVPPGLLAQATEVIQ